MTILRFALLALLASTAHAQDWGRYSQVPSISPSLSEIQVIRQAPTFTPPPSAVPKVVPNAPPFVFPTPPGVGQSVKRK